MMQRNLEEILAVMQDVQYGYVTDTGERVIDMKSRSDEFFKAHYLVQTGKEVLESKVGTCFDQTEVERYLLEAAGHQVTTYFLYYWHETENSFPTHSWATLQDNGEYIWIEHAWGDQAGIHRYKSLQELLTDVAQKDLAFLHEEYPDFSFQPECLHIYEFPTPPSHLSFGEYLDFTYEGTREILVPDLLAGKLVYRE